MIKIDDDFDTLSCFILMKNLKEEYKKINLDLPIDIWTAYSK